MIAPGTKNTKFKQIIEILTKTNLLGLISFAEHPVNTNRVVNHTRRQQISQHKTRLLPSASSSTTSV